MRAAAFALDRGRRERELSALLCAPRELDEAPAVAPPAGRALRILLSCAEPSGELHAVNLAHALRAELAAAGAPAPELLGLGGPRLSAAGARILDDPVARAAMGAAALRNLGYYLGLFTRVAAELRAHPVDLVLAVDSPALHVPLGRIARAYGARVVHLVTPQYWGWAPWRIGAYRRAVDLALSILPFEPAWFERRGMRVAYVGHPIQDELAAVPATRAGPESRVLALLPGSRETVLERNLPWMLSAAARVRLELSELEVVLPHARPELEPLLRRHVAAAHAERWVRIEIGGLHEALGRARAALSVSGTVLLNLLHHRLPSVVIYRLGGPLSTFLARRLVTAPYFASINLLAGRAVLPEFCFHGTGPFEEVSRALHASLTDESWRRECIAGLDEAARRLGPPGAVRRAARHALAVASQGRDAAVSTSSKKP